MDALYGAVADAKRWPEVVRAVEHVLGGAVSILYRPSPFSLAQRILATNLDAQVARAYEDHFGAVNPWVLAMQGPRPAVHFGDDPVEPSLIERSEFYADFLRPLGDLRYNYSFSARSTKGAFVEIAAVRPRALGPISGIEGNLLSSFAPHLQRAIDLAQRLHGAEAGQAASVAAVQRLGTGLLLVDADRRIVVMDEEAERVLQGGGLLVRAGRLRSAGALDAQLGEALARATGAGRQVSGRTGSLIAVPRGPDRLSLSVAVSPVDERDRFGLAGPLAMVLVTDPERSHRPSADALRALFGLTLAEARLVVALCSGETLSDYAASTDTSLNTAKTHLKRVFDKTGDTRQADLVRRISTDLALRVGSEEIAP